MKTMTSMERTLCTLGHQEPDKVPLFLLFSHYGAKYLKMGIEEYFKSPEKVVQAQIELREKYNTDCFYTFQYAGIETEAMGGEVLFQKESPPNAGSPIITEFHMISSLKIPVLNSEPLRRILDITESLNRYSKGNVPIIGVVMSPFALPVMQLGFDKYIQMLYEEPDSFKQLMNFNQEFCINWANAQLEAGATAICYFNPLASREIIEEGLYRKTGYRVDINTTKRIKGPIAYHLASALSYPSINDVIESGSLVIGASNKDDLLKMKEKTKEQLTILGNINAIDLVHSSKQDIEVNIRNIIKEAGAGGGLILSDNHGEIPWQVPSERLVYVSEALNSLGRYPLSL